MTKDKTNSAILIVLLAGILWSFGALVVRYIEDARSVPWQYLFFRGLTIFVLLNLYLFVKEGKSRIHPLSLSMHPQQHVFAESLLR